MSSAPGTRLPRRVAVIGDVGGHLRELTNELARLGADPRTGALPDDLLVVQVGDLVHRGPESDAVIAQVDHYLTTQPGNWIQLVGNHEAQYLREPAFDWYETVSRESQQSIQRWWSTGAMQAAVWLDTVRGPFLVTHAGLTANFWRAVLDTPPTAAAAAVALNSLRDRREEALFRPGVMLRGGRPHRTAGPIWAEAGQELIASWLDTRMPFNQVHGHSSVYDWERQTLRCPSKVAELTVIDDEAKHEITEVGGGVIVGIDPGHGTSSRTPWRSWESLLQQEPDATDPWDARPSSSP